MFFTLLPFALLILPLGTCLVCPAPLLFTLHYLTALARSKDPTYRLVLEQPIPKAQSHVLSLKAHSPSTHLHLPHISSVMGVTRKVLKEGNGADKPKKGDDVTIEYTGNLYDEAQASNDHRGKQ